MTAAPVWAGQIIRPLLAADGGGLPYLPWPLVWAILTGVAGLWLMLPRSGRRSRPLGAALGVISLGLLAAGLPALRGPLAQGVFWVLAGVTLAAAAATISMRSAVYSAIWFALSVLGTAGLFFYQGAQFLGVATVVVYAGAIVVTFLFVIMLAQPQGYETYDRLTWGWYSKPLSLLASAAIVAVLTVALAGVREAIAADGGSSAAARAEGVMHPEHMARFGAVLFSQHLLAVELAGTLLLVAFVGAVAITIQGRHYPDAQAEERRP